MAEFVAPAPAAGGQAAPAGFPGKQQSGPAAPALTGKPAGEPSPQSLQDAIVAEKKKAEHWRTKAKEEAATNAVILERLAKLEGLAQGIQANVKPADKPAKTIADLDESGIDAVVKKGFDEENPGFIAEAAKEFARRAAEKAKAEAIATSRAEAERMNAEQSMSQRIVQDFGAKDVMDTDSDLRQLADRNAARLLARDPDIFKKAPEALYGCFAAAQLELRAGERDELASFRKAEADRQAREELERSNQVIATKAKADVAELLARGDKQSRREALMIRLPQMFARDKR